MAQGIGRLSARKLRCARGWKSYAEQNGVTTAVGRSEKTKNTARIVEHEMNRIMVDLETLGTSNRAAIISIGLVAFTATEILEQLHINVMANQGREIDSDTVMWWFGQEREALDALFNPAQVYISEALASTADFFYKHKPYEVWAKPPSFDLAILHDAFCNSLVLAKRRVWPRKSERCFRTALALSPDIGSVRNKTPHSAIEDALHQTRILIQSGLLKDD